MLLDLKAETVSDFRFLFLKRSAQHPTHSPSSLGASEQGECAPKICPIYRLGAPHEEHTDVAALNERQSDLRR